MPDFGTAITRAVAQLIDAPASDPTQRTVHRHALTRDGHAFCGVTGRLRRQPEPWSGLVRRQRCPACERKLPHDD